MDAVALVGREGNVAKTCLRASKCIGCCSAQQLWCAGAPDLGRESRACRPQRHALIDVKAPEACRHDTQECASSFEVVLGSALEPSDSREDNALLLKPVTQKPQT